MGKPTGFLEYQRNPIPDRPALERVKDWVKFMNLLMRTRYKHRGRAAWTAVPLLSHRYVAQQHGQWLSHK